MLIYNDDDDQDEDAENNVDIIGKAELMEGVQPQNWTIWNLILQIVLLRYIIVVIVIFNLASWLVSCTGSL